MPLHKNMLFSTTTKSATGVSLWKNEATAHSHAQWTKSVQWCLVDQARFCVSSFLCQVHHDLVVFLWCFFFVFLPSKFWEKSIFDIASLKQFLSCVSCSTGPVHHPMSSTAANVSFLSHCGVWQKLHANRQFLHCARFVNWFFSENIFANKKLPSSSQMAIRTLQCWSLAWCQWTWLSSHFLGIVSLHVKDTPLQF